MPKIIYLSFASIVKINAGHTVLIICSSLEFLPSDYFTIMFVSCNLESSAVKSTSTSERCRIQQVTRLLRLNDVIPVKRPVKRCRRLVVMRNQLKSVTCLS